ncbi:MAG: Nramp family divalent metal transporter [Stellaceae bacterium]
MPHAPFSPAAATGAGVRRCPVAGPAVIASVASMDPGNFATNIQVDAGHGYTLLWVVVLANLVAMLFQGLSAKLGIVTGRNLVEFSRAHFPRAVVLAMWLVSEIAAMATDLAEFLGAALGLALLFHPSLLAAMVVAGVATYALLGLQRNGFRPIELAIGGLVAIIGAAYLVELLIAPPDWRAVAVYSLVPQFDGGDAVLLAVGIVGATVMPHAIFLHSALTQDRIVPRNETERRKLIRFSHREVGLALGFAGLVNLAMVAMVASVFHDGAHDGIANVGVTYHTLGPLLGAAAAAAFLAALIASGLSSSTVGTMAWQVVMQGFVGFRVPLGLRRAADHGAILRRRRRRNRRDARPGVESAGAELRAAGADGRAAAAATRRDGRLRQFARGDRPRVRRRCGDPRAQSRLGARDRRRRADLECTHMRQSCRICIAA